MIYDEKLCEWCNERCTDWDNVVLVVVKLIQNLFIFNLRLIYDEKQCEWGEKKDVTDCCSRCC